MSRLDLSKLKFLVIDDFAGYRSMVKGILRSACANHIDDASDGPSAIKKLTQNQYDVILCDYNLGEGQNGQQILEEVKFRDLLGYSTIYIMVTAENTMDMVMGAVDYKPDEYLTKPFTKEVLGKRLDKIILKKAGLKSIYRASDKGQYEKALKLCDASMKENPKLLLEIAKLKGELCLKVDKVDLAEKVYNKVLTIREFAWAKLGLAKVNMRRNEFSEAQEILEDLIEENKTFAEAYDLLAEAYEKDGDLENAQQIITKAIKLSPNTVTRHKALGLVALKNNDLDMAERSCKKAIKLGKYSYLKSSSDYVRLAKVHMEKKNTDEALRIINEAKQDYRHDPDGLIHIRIMTGKIQKSKGNDDVAQDIFDNVLKDFTVQSGDLSEEVIADMAETCSDFGEDEMADAILKDLKGGLSDSEIEKRERAKRYKLLQMNREGMKIYANGDIEKAMSLFEKAADGLQDNISINMNAAQAYVAYVQKHNENKDMLDKARKYLDISKEIDAKNEKYLKLEDMYKKLLG